MDDYSKLLLLTYICQYKEKYTVADLKAMLGMTCVQFDALLDDLFKLNYLIYENYLLSVTVHGKAFIANSSMYKYNHGNLASQLICINPQIATSLDEVYIPEGFLRKI